MKTRSAVSSAIHSEKRKSDSDEDYAGDTLSDIVDNKKKQKFKEGSSNKRETRIGTERENKEKVNKKKNTSANIISRQSPYQLVQTLKSLTDRQKTVLREIGFGCMVDFSIEYLPMSLALLLVDRLDVEKCEMLVGEKLMKITKKDVHEILGFPMGNKEVKSIRKAGLVKNDLVETWKLRFPKPESGSQKIKLTDVKKKINDELEGGSIFKIDILLSIVTIMAEGITCGTINQRVLGSINDENDIKDMDWCGYVIDCLKRSKDKWSKDSWYTGPLTFLVLWYAQNISKKQKGNPIILHWTTEELKSIEQIELSGANSVEKIQSTKPLSIDYPFKVSYDGDGYEDPEYNKETNFDLGDDEPLNAFIKRIRSKETGNLSTQTIEDLEGRKQVFFHKLHKACDNVHISNEEFLSTMKSGLAEFLGDLDVIRQINIVKERWLKDLELCKQTIEDDVDAAIRMHDNVVFEMDTRLETKVDDGEAIASEALLKLASS